MCLRLFCSVAVFAEVKMQSGPPSQGPLAKPRPNFVFVDQPGGKKRPSHRKLVSSHVRFNYHQKKRLRAIESYQSSLQRTREALSGDEGKSQTVDEHFKGPAATETSVILKTAHANLEAISSVPKDVKSGSGLLIAVQRATFGSQPQTLLDGADPTAPPTLSGDTKFLLNHYVNDLVSRLFSSRAYTTALNKWLVPLTLTEPLALFAVSALASTHLRHLNLGIPGSEQLTEQQPLCTKIRLLHEVREHLEHPHQWGPHTFFALFALISVEIQAGSLDAALAHTRGLAKFACLKGNIQIPDYIFGMMQSCVYTIASETGTRDLVSPPPFSSHTSSRLSFLAQKVAYPAPESFIQGFISANPPFLDPAMLEIIHEIRDCLVLSEAARCNELELALPDLKVLQHKKWDITRRLMKPISEQNKRIIEDIQIMSEEELRYDACRLALNLLSYNLMKGFVPATSVVVRSLVGELTVILRRTDITSSWHPYEKILFWILFLGANCCFSLAEWPWYELQLSREAELLHLKTWNQARQVLSYFFYVDYYMEEPFQEIWRRVQILRLKPK